MRGQQRNTILHGDALAVLKTLPSESVDCVITSPPYFALRDYGVTGQLGLERTPEEFVRKLVVILRECRRVLKSEGTLWLNLGDSYAARGIEPKWQPAGVSGLKAKDLVGIPWMVAFALREDGWYLRQDIIWAKTNPMPESVTDRCTKSHEYVFVLSKSPRYYFNAEAIKEPATCAADKRRRQGRLVYRDGKRRGAKGTGQTNFVSIKDKRNKRSVWSVTTSRFKGAHFATFPEKLVEPMVLAACRPQGLVLDPFMGAGTTALVARKLERNYLGIELNRKFIRIAQRRLEAS